MTTDTTASRTSRYQLLTAGHHFLTNALPLDRSRTPMALETFAAAISRVSPLPADLDMVLLRCLTVLGRSAKKRIPSLTDVYLSRLPEHVDPLGRFSHCVLDLLQFSGVNDGAVQDALTYINDNHCNSSCTPQAVADSIGVRLSTLDVAFKRETGHTPTECIRYMRVQTAATLLSTTSLSIKEVWAQVGYNHHSNFDHDFKHHFGVTPTVLRKTAIRPVARGALTCPPPPAVSLNRQNGDEPKTKVMLVDDDEGTRLTLERWLHQDGYSVTTRSTSAECLRDIERFAPHVVLLDYHLDDANGIECLRALRRVQAGRAASVAIFTADLDVLEQSDEIAELNAIVASKLCDLERVSDLVAYLRSPDHAAPGRIMLTPPWKEWTPFL